MAELLAQKREILGRKTKRLRKEGLIPAELYGHGVENVHLSVPKDKFAEVYKDAGEHAIVNVVIEGEEKRPVLINEVQVDPVTDEVLAIDLHQVRMDEKVSTHVPVDFIGESPAVVEQDGVLVKVMDEIEVEALPADIPPSIEVDLGKLTEIDQSIYIKDLPKSDKYEIVADEDSVIASVSEQREEEEEPVEELSPEDVIVEGEEERTEEGESQPQEESGDEQNKEAEA